MRAIVIHQPRPHLSRVAGLLMTCAIGCGGAAAGATGVGSPVPPHSPVPPALTAGDVTFTIDPGATFAISRFIYGGNFIDGTYDGATPPAEMTFNRVGGNRLSAYNWETNYSNAGRDYRFQNDTFLSESSTPGAAVRDRAQVSFGRGQAFMATIPMLGHVARNANGVELDTLDVTRDMRLAQHFRVSRAAKGSAFSTSPDRKDAFVYQDEFVSWFDRTFPGHAGAAQAPVFFSLDNEPDIWHATHKEVQSDIDDDAQRPRIQTYAGLTDTSIVYARAIKTAMPAAIVFGPAVATYAGIVTAGRYPAPDPQFGTQNFLDVYLARMQAAEARAGRRLLDVLDVHWYPASGTPNGEITNDYAKQDSAMIQRRVQAPRSLWDSTYDEESWVSGTTGGPVRLIPRLKAQIAANYPGTKLAITEYYFGRGGDISGGVAQADALGVFAREGLYAAAFWPQAQVWAPPYDGDGRKAYAYVFAAFRMFLNYDGSGARFGDIGLQARTSDIVGSSVYASRDAAGRIVIVAINKGTTARTARVAITGVSTIRGATVWALANGTPNPVRQAAAPAMVNGQLTVVMPAMSVSTVAVVP